MNANNSVVNTHSSLTGERVNGTNRSASNRYHMKWQCEHVPNLFGSI